MEVALVIDAGVKGKEKENDKCLEIRMKALVKALTLLLLFGGCSNDQGFHDGFRTYGEPTATAIENDIVTDTFVPVHAEPVDILFVVDNSCSMTYHQQNLADNLPQLANKLLRMNMNYRIGFTTTSYYDSGRLRELPTNKGYVYWIEPDTRGKKDLFVYGATPGTHGHGFESGFYGTYCAIENCGDTPNLLRKGSSFHTIVVSDEPEQGFEITSIYEGKRFARNLKTHNFIPWFNELRDSSSFSIIGDDYHGIQTEYHKVARKTGGYIMSLDQNDWSAFTDNLIENIEFDPEYRFYLTKIPADYTKLKITLCVDMDDDEQCVPWSTSPDITHVYKYNKKHWSYEYDFATNSVVLISPKRAVQDYDVVVIKYEIPTGSPQIDEK